MTTGPESQDTHCPNCGWIDVADSRFCVRCGIPLVVSLDALTTEAMLFFNAQDWADPASPGSRCPACGWTDVPSTAYCAVCGKAMVAPSVADAPAVANKNKRGLLAVVAAVLLLAAGATGWALASRNKGTHSATGIVTDGYGPTSPNGQTPLTQGSDTGGSIDWHYQGGLSEHQYAVAVREHLGPYLAELRQKGGGGTTHDPTVESDAQVAQDARDACGSIQGNMFLIPSGIGMMGLSPGAEQAIYWYLDEAMANYCPNVLSQWKASLGVGNSS